MLQSSFVTGMMKFSTEKVRKTFTLKIYWQQLVQVVTGVKNFNHPFMVSIDKHTIGTPPWRLKHISTMPKRGGEDVNASKMWFE